jgi:hypothetical protein
MPGNGRLPTPLASVRKRLAKAVVWRASFALAVSIALHPGTAAAASSMRAMPGPRVVQTLASNVPEPTFAPADVVYVATWVADTGDNAGMPYVIIDKIGARVYLWDGTGHLQGSAPALLGMVAGDGSVPGIGDRKLSAIRPDQRTTPAGRFIASMGHDLHGADLLWIDYATALALHRVVKGTPDERRAQRLSSETAADNRISYGCINVPVRFFDTIVAPAFASSSGVVYILPETSPARALFGPDAPVRMNLPVSPTWTPQDAR